MSARLALLRDHRRVSELSVILTVAVFAVAVWQRRWTTDDAFINFRIVSNIRAGHGPVFNPGELVEAGTSPLWVFLLAVLDLYLPVRLEWIAVVTGLAAAVLAVALVLRTNTGLFLGRRPELVLPTGIWLYIALPPAWDFATSGLETGVGLLWIASCWCVLVRRYRHVGAPRPVWPAGLLIGLGPLIRPDFGIFVAAFAVAGLLTSPRRSQRLAWILWVAVLPVSVEVMRIAYYGLLVPNTALAKEASMTYWSQGWMYLLDLVTPYWLVAAMLVVAALAVPVVCDLVGRIDRRWLWLVGLTVGSGVVHALYVVRVGGDYMHGRLLLPSLFVIVIPFAVLPVSSWRVGLATALLGWAALCMSALRPAYSVVSWSREDTFPMVATDEETGIGDERHWYTLFADHPHPVTTDDYASTPWVQGGMLLRDLERAGTSGVVTGADLGRFTYLAPVGAGGDSGLIAYTGSMGMFAHVAGTRVAIIDNYGLGNALASHQRLLERRRIGHEKALSVEWVIAAYGDPAAPPVPGVDPERLRAARRALTCGELAELTAMVAGPIDLDRLLANVTRAPRMTSLRFHPDPLVAEQEMCG